MAISTFSLPIDIPWQRIAFSHDMIDPRACDRSLPSRWKSSVAVFSYEPPEEQQRIDAFRVSYLKISCTITGLQAYGPEIRIRERLDRSGWKRADLTEMLGKMAAQYYACHGAILEVVVAPHANETRFGLSEYPYFADFDPKKRELYEVVTETGETMSRSLEDVNVRLGQTTLQSHEVRDKTTLGAGLSASYMGVTASGSVANESGTTDLSQQSIENVRTSDAAREARETFSHTTQLSQMYHQLNSYHIGTNRAAFFVLPRPHTLQSPATFVNGPREIEGVQEFMLVVVRPKEMEHFCVEAYLETAHLTGEPIYDWGETDVPLQLSVHSPDNTNRSDTRSTAARAGYIVDRKRGPQGVPLGGVPHGDTGGFLLVSALENDIPRSEGSSTSDYSFVVGTEQVTANGRVAGWPGRGDRKATPGKLEVSATVYLKKAVPTIVGREPGLLITGRAVCSCRPGLSGKVHDINVVYEKSLVSPETRINWGKSMSVQDANLLGVTLKRELLESLSSADRYPRGEVGLLDSQLLAGMMGTHIRHATSEANPLVSEWPGVDRNVTRRVSQYGHEVTRSELLEMPLPRQVEAFGLTFSEAVELRRSLMDIPAPDGPPPVPARVTVTMPLLAGLPSHEAHALISSAGLVLGSATTVDSEMPAGTVVAQEPEPGASLERGAVVSMQSASGRSVRLPEVLGQGLSEALYALRTAGLQSEPAIVGRPGADARVTELEPPAGSMVTPQTTVTVKLKQQRASGH